MDINKLIRLVDNLFLKLYNKLNNKTIGYYYMIRGLRKYDEIKLFYKELLEIDNEVEKWILI